MDASQIGKRAWSYAGVLQDAGLSCFEYVEQLTLLLFLKMADQLTEPPYNRAAIIPLSLGWKALLPLDGVPLEDKYRDILGKLAVKPGMLGLIFKSARCEIHNPALLKQLIVNLIDKVDWLGMPVDVKGTIYEELLQRSAQESSRGAGQYFTPRPVIQAMCEVMQPTPSDRICDPAAGTGGFLCNSYKYVLDLFVNELDSDEQRTLSEELVEGMELSPKVGRMCAMNLYLHGIGGDKVVLHAGHDSLAAPCSKEYTMVLANPPFGKKQSLLFVNEEGDTEKDDQIIFREDFWTSTSNKQLNFVQHIYTLLKIDGRCAMVVPDNVLFEGGAGEKVRRNLLQKCRVHTLLRLPTGIWYSAGVKANVIFFDKKEGRAKAWTDKLWVYDLRTNQHFTLKQKPIQRSDFDEFVECYRPGSMQKRKPTWNEGNLDGRWRSYAYEELLKRDKLTLDLFWIKDKSLTDTESLPAPEVIAAEIADDLEAALAQFTKIAARLAKGRVNNSVGADTPSALTRAEDLRVGPDGKSASASGSQDSK
jgi:type I restriction enzyme M protein